MARKYLRQMANLAALTGLTLLLISYSDQPQSFGAMQPEPAGYENYFAPMSLAPGQTMRVNVAVVTPTRRVLVRVRIRGKMGMVMFEDELTLEPGQSSSFDFLYRGPTAFQGTEQTTGNPPFRAEVKAFGVNSGVILSSVELIDGDDSLPHLILMPTLLPQINPQQGTPPTK
jgi:hypothetical protein